MTLTRSVAVLTVLALAALAVPAQISTGNFGPGQNWYLNPGTGDRGIRFPLPGATTIDIDTATAGWQTYQLPAEVRPDAQSPARYTTDYALSPTRAVLYAVKYNVNGGTPVCGGTSDTQVFLYGLGAPSGAGPYPMTAFTGAQGTCMHSPLAIGPKFWDVDGARIRTMVLVASTTPAPQKQWVLWGDLVGNQLGLDMNDYGPNVEEPQFAPSGNAAFMRYDTLVLPSRYAIVDLCKSPVGGAAGFTSRPVNIANAFTAARVVDAGGGAFQAVVSVNGVDEAPIPLDVHCYTGTSSCCFVGGSCQDLTPQACSQQGGQSGPNACAQTSCTESCCADGSCRLVSPAQCAAQGGTRQFTLTCQNVWCPPPTVACCDVIGTCYYASGSCPAGSSQAGNSCDTAHCPVLHFDVQKTGPSDKVAGETIDYVITYRNTGDVTGTAAVLRDTLPYGLSFVSASDGGTQTTFGVVEWNLGDVAPGQSGTRTMTAQIACAGLSSLNNYAQVLTKGVSFMSNAATTNVTDPPSAPLTVTVASVGAAGLPVKGGDVITHTVHLVNTTGARRPGLSIYFSPGQGMTLETLVNPGSGTMVQNSPTDWQWKGALPADGSTDIVFTSRVDGCTPRTSVALNGGYVDVYDSCTHNAGTGAAPVLPVRRAVDPKVQSITVPVRTSLETAISQGFYQAVRKGTTVDVQLTLTNSNPAAKNAASLSHRVPTGLTPVGNPPFVPPTDPAATWNSSNRTISWSGPLAAGQTVTVTYRATVDVNPPCPIGMTMSGGDGTCTINDSSNLLTVSAPPAPPYATVLTATNMYTFRPGVDTGLVGLTCFPNEAVGNGTRAVNGDLWAVALPTFRLNPDTLLLEGLPYTFFRTLGFSPGDVAVDERDGTVLFAGGGTIGFTPYTMLKRYDPTTHALTTILDASMPGPGQLKEIVVERTGFVGGLTYDGSVFRIDPVNRAFTQLPTGVVTRAATLNLDDDGAYVVTQSSFSSPVPMVKVDPATGAVTTITSDVLGLIPTARTPFQAAMSAGGGDVLLSYSFSGLGRVRRTPALSGQELIAYSASGRPEISLGWAGGACATDADGDGAKTGPGCGPGYPVDCNDADPNTRPNAPEINDGKDNQCPGDAGYGSVDEVSGSVFFDAADRNKVCWPAQAGATQYQLVRSSTPNFTSGCTRFNVATTCATDTGRPAGGAGYWYLVRATAPNAGSWGRNSAGVERTVTCP